MDILRFEKQINKWGQQNVPFLFMIDFEMQNPFLSRLDELDNTIILYDLDGLTNVLADGDNPNPLKDSLIIKRPISFAEYKRKFEQVYHELLKGNSYLTNLTVKTEIELRQTLRDIFYRSSAKYKVFVENKFLVFSPETFVKIENDTIRTFPMKGTISASVPNAKKIILEDRKELAEHVTIVDLLRNDLSLVSDKVSVSRFRYLEEITTSRNTLYQVSSEIVGHLPNAFEKLGTTLVTLLPAGSVSGAPKRKTVDIIRQAEGEARGYYTGVVGIFDGRKFDSAVMIRYIENNNGRYYYRSGGGITTQSIVDSEYREVLDKIYVPVN